MTVSRRRVAWVSKGAKVDGQVKVECGISSRVKVERRVWVDMLDNVSSRQGQG